MQKRTVTVKVAQDLETRSIALFVQTASAFESDIFIEDKDGEKRANAKSIMGMMAIGISLGDTVTLIADGEDEEAALDRMEDFLS